MMADHRCSSSTNRSNQQLDEKRVATEQAISINKELRGSQTDNKQSVGSPSINKNSKKHFEQQKHSYEEVVIGKRVVIPRFYNEVYERKRLFSIIEDVTDLIWADVRSSLGFDNEESIWWPGRILTDEERNLFKTTPLQDVLLNKNTNILVELFGFRDEHFRYHPIIVNRKVIRSLFDPEVNRDAAAFIGDPNRRLDDKQTIIRYFNNGLSLLDQLCQDRNYTKETASSILQMEGDTMLNDTSIVEVDSTYEQRLAKNIVEIEGNHEDRETLHAGEIIGYYYKPFGPVGDKRAYFETHILEIYDYNGRKMMKLENNHVLAEDTQVKRICDIEGIPIESDGQYKCLGEYEMALTTVSSSMKERMNDLEKLKTDLADIRTFYNK
ncbi:hypothetical protein WA171_004934, partial [Blastocystis sp. BT1]